MDKYLLDEYKKINIDDVKETKKRQIKKEKAIDLLNKGIGIEEIAEILETTEAEVRRYLGKKRIAEFEEAIKEGKEFGEEEDPEKEEENEEIRLGDSFKRQTKKEGKADFKKEDRQSQQNLGLGGKLTLKQVEKMVPERNQKIKFMAEEGMSIEEIAKKEMMTIDQVKEIYLSMGMSIYTEDELEKMRQESERRKLEEQKEREEQERLEKERSKQEAKKESEQNSEQEGPKTFEDIKRTMAELIKQKRSKAAIDFAEPYIDNTEMLTEKERNTLYVLVNYIKEARERYENKGKKERKRTPRKTSTKKEENER